MFPYNESPRSSTEVIVPFLVHSQLLRNGLAVLCQRWVNIIRIIQEKNSWTWIFEEQTGLENQFLYNSSNSFLTFLRVYILKAPGHWWATSFIYYVSSLVPVTSETNYSQDSDNRHWKKTLMRGIFIPNASWKCFIFSDFSIQPLPCFSKLLFALTNSQIHFPS